MNLITAVYDCNARPCQKPSYFIRVELVLEAKVCETLCFQSGDRIYGRMQRQEQVLWDRRAVFFTALFPFPQLFPGFLKNLKIFFPPNFLQKRQFCRVTACHCSCVTRLTPI